MTCIHKYELKPGALKQVIVMSENASHLDIQYQHGTPVLWVVEDTEGDKRNQVIIRLLTGHQLPENSGMLHIATIMSPDNNFVEHWFWVLA